MPASNAFTGGDKVDADTWTWDFGASKLLGTGGSLRVDYLNNKQDTNSVYAVFNPTYNATIGAALTQPLARDFKTDATRTNLRVAKLTRDISDEQFRQVVTNTVALAKKQYYDISFAIDNLEAKRKSLALADKLLSENRIKVKVGTLAPLDVVEAEAEVASRAEGVIQAEALLASVQDNLKQTLLPANDTAMWSVSIVPTDRPTAAPPLRRPGGRHRHRAARTHRRGGRPQGPGRRRQPALRQEPAVAGDRPGGLLLRQRRGRHHDPDPRRLRRPRGGRGPGRLR